MSTALKDESKHVPEFAVYSLLKSETVTIRETYCQGSWRRQSTEERTTSTQLVFPYRGVYVRHLGDDQAVAEANQVLFFNADEGYRISHPVAGVLLEQGREAAVTVWDSNRRRGSVLTNWTTSPTVGLLRQRN